MDLNEQIQAVLDAALAEPTPDRATTLTAAAVTLIHLFKEREPHRRQQVGDWTERIVTDMCCRRRERLTVQR
jgi:hypothetical protein